MGNLSEIRKSLINIKTGLMLNTQARGILREEFHRQVTRYQKHLEDRIRDSFDSDLSRKIDALNMLLEN